MKRKIVSLFLALWIIALPSSNACAEGKPSFSDVPPNAWYFSAVEYLTEQGVISGLPDGSFQPQSDITRAQFLMMLAQASGQTINGTRFQQVFQDVNPASWCAGCIAWGVKEKVVSGMGENTFAPDAPITRQQMAVMLCRFNKNVMGRIFSKKQAPLFNDETTVSSWAHSEVNTASSVGWMNGYEDKTFRPNQNATRAEAAQVVFRYLDKQTDYSSGCSIEKLRHIAHAGGEANGIYKTSNSWEAIQEAYACGNRTIELDFSWTLDNKLACVHNWGGVYPPRSTLDQFMKSQIFGKLTPIDLDTLAQWLRSHPDVFIIPDFKEKNIEGLRLISRQYPDLVGRFIPYLYHRWEYIPVREMGYKNMILILYQMSVDEKNDVAGNVAFARENDLSAIAISGAESPADYCKTGREQGVPILVYVVNSLPTMERYAAMGADGFFSDRQTVKLDWD